VSLISSTPVEAGGGGRKVQIEVVPSSQTGGLYGAPVYSLQAGADAPPRLYHCSG
jgi:hypothetical protein